MRPSGRAPDALRPVSLEPGVAKYAEGSCLARFGDTHVLCTATVEERVPPFLRNTGRGWVTAEYGMLPRSTAYPHRPRGGARQAERAHAGNPAADRPQPARRHRPRRARRAPDPHRLRRAAGRWRHPHGGDHRQLCRAVSGAGETRRCRAAGVDAARRQRRGDLVRRVRRGRRCSTSTMPRIRRR